MPVQRRRRTGKPSEASRQLPARREISIPEGAVQIEPETYSHTDAQGNTRIFRNTPFGVMSAPQQEAGIPEGMTANEEGDNLRFERTSPFGVHRWTRKKTELTELERKVWEREQSGRR